MQRYKPPKIEDIGLETYLDQTRSKHKGYGYKEFADMHSRNVPTSGIAKVFSVDRKTVMKWRVIFDNESMNL